MSRLSKVPLPTPEGPHTTTGRVRCCCSSAEMRLSTELRVWLLANGPRDASEAPTGRISMPPVTRPALMPQALRRAIRRIRMCDCSPSLVKRFNPAFFSRGTKVEPCTKEEPCTKVQPQSTIKVAVCLGPLSHLSAEILLLFRAMPSAMLVAIATATGTMNTKIRDTTVTDSFGTAHNAPPARMTFGIGRNFRSQRV